jgi:hypothetical protein
MVGDWSKRMRFWRRRQPPITTTDWENGLGALLDQVGHNPLETQSPRGLVRQSRRAPRAIGKSRVSPFATLAAVTASRKRPATRTPLKASAGMAKSVAAIWSRMSDRVFTAPIGLTRTPSMYYRNRRFCSAGPKTSTAVGVLPLRLFAPRDRCYARKQRYEIVI